MLLCYCVVLSLEIGEAHIHGDGENPGCGIVVLYPGGRPNSLLKCEGQTAHPYLSHPDVAFRVESGADIELVRLLRRRFGEKQECVVYLAGLKDVVPNYSGLLLSRQRHGRINVMRAMIYRQGAALCN